MSESLVPNIDDSDWDSLYALSQNLMDHVELSEIRTLRVEAELIDANVADNLEIGEQVATAQVQHARPHPEALVYRTRHEDVYTDSEGNDGARTLVEFGIVFTCPADIQEPTDEEMRAFAVTTVVRLLQPYYREAVSALLGRIGLPGVTVGLVRFPVPESGE